MASGAAQSPATMNAERAVLVEVTHAANPEASYKSLDASDKALFSLALTHQTATPIVSESGRLSNAQAVKLGLKPDAALSTAASVSPMASGCWWHYQYDAWSNLDIAEGDTWYQLNWCANNGTITSYSPSDIGCAGENGSTCNGVNSKWGVDVGWEVRYVVQYNFSNVLYFVSAQPCEQIRGGATGLYYENESCSTS